jgi:hypothetical protein
MNSPLMFMDSTSSKFSSASQISDCNTQTLIYTSVNSIMMPPTIAATSFPLKHLNA